MQPKTNSRAWNLLTCILFAAVFAGLAFVHAAWQQGMAAQDERIAMLVDEIGSVAQENFSLSEQISSQEMVLQTLEGDISASSSKVKRTADGPVILAEEIDLTAPEDDGTFDIMILGTNGAHTDTIIVASVNDAEEKITLFSIPRDLYINGRRINEYYYYYGVDQLERMVEVVTGIEIDRYAKVDLTGFTEVVDLLGGIDVYVDKAIYDGYYPNGKGGYDAFSIEEGSYHMSGTEALKYARSRKSTSDFDRAARQQKILAALRNKLFQLDSIMDLKTMTGLFETGLSTIETNASIFDLLGYYYDYQDYSFATGFVLSTSNYLHSIINESGAYILLPKTGNFEEIHGVIEGMVN